MTKCLKWCTYLSVFVCQLQAEHLFSVLKKKKENANGQAEINDFLVMSKNKK